MSACSPSRAHIVIDAATPQERGVQRATQLGDGINRAVAKYFELFHLAGLDDNDIEQLGTQSLRNVAAWRSRYAAEIESLADACDLPRWQLGALNARTEILMSQQDAMSLAGECSTIGYAGERVVAAQTWDWHEELSDYWHMQTVVGENRTAVGVAEYGMLGKIGINDAGLAVFLNILSSKADGTSGVPIHVILPALLAECASVAEALELLASVSVGSSSNITVVDEHEIAGVELSPGGISIRRPDDRGWIVHTNHYLDADLARGETPGRFGEDSYQRYDLVGTRLAEAEKPEDPADLVGYVCSGPGEPHLSCVPDPDAAFGFRSRTLVTAVADPATCTFSVLDGMPTEAGEKEWVRLRAEVAMR